MTFFRNLYSALNIEYSYLPFYPSVGYIFVVTVDTGSRERASGKMENVPRGYQ
jgi:hypothetical protein